MPSNKRVKVHPTDALLAQLGLLKDPVVEEAVKQRLAEGDDELWENEEIIEEVMSQQKIVQDDLTDELHWGLGVLMHRNALEMQQSEVARFVKTIQLLLNSNSTQTHQRKIEIIPATQLGGQRLTAHIALSRLSRHRLRKIHQCLSLRKSWRKGFLEVNIADNQPHLGAVRVIATRDGIFLKSKVTWLRYEGPGAGWSCQIELRDLFENNIPLEEIDYDVYPACIALLPWFSKNEVETMLKEVPAKYTEERKRLNQLNSLLQS